MPSIIHSLRSRCLLSACACGLLALPAAAQTPIGDLAAPDASVRGSVQTVATGTRVMSGSSVTAGANTAGVRLLRGGELNVCPRATVSLTTSPSGRDLAIGLDTGGIETHYRVRSSAADTIMTPDFRILLAGPGNFDYAISADARGNTCIRSLGANGGSVIVSEIMGDGTYQVQSGESVYFRNGSVANPGKNTPPDCGCPAPVPTMNANAPAPQTPVPSVQTPAASAPPPAQQQVPSQPAKVPANSPEAAFAEYGHALPVPTTLNESGNGNSAAPSPDSEIHLQVDAPLVFQGDAPANIPSAPQIAHLRLAYLPKLIAETQDTTVLPPARPAKRNKKELTKEQKAAAPRGFFGHVKSFFGSIFR